ncbi:hypothetical protein [Chthonomonas calidirosea]|uniref:hypothetical protein n=1 Tax=Chthonomonas calidirosea TaxID=454171 RepID=UPI0006ECC730|nr:hypothetical protein [Chthonomonas calidirosea]CEK13028.1 hypothetical protein CP488_00324 [Chthonomonas calidirosea]
MSLQANLSPRYVPSPLNVLLRRATLRIRAARLLRFGTAGLCAGSWLAVLLLGASKLRLLPPVLWLEFGPILLGLFIGAAVALLPRLSTLSVARLTEQRADLKERLSSAIALETSDSMSPFFPALRDDAERHAASVDLKAIYPLRIPRTFWLSLLALALLAGVTLLPSLPLFWSKEKKAEMNEVKKEGVRIVRLAQQAEKEATQKHLPMTKQAAEELKKLGTKMREGKLDKVHAMVAMNKLTQKLAEQQRRLAAQKQNAAQAQQAAQQLKQSLQKLDKQLQQRQQVLQRMAANQQMNPNNALRNGQQARQQHGAQKNGLDALKKHAEQMQQLKKELASLQKMQQALQAMQQALQMQNSQAMQQAMQQLSQLAQQSMGNPQLAQQMGQQLQSLAQALQLAGLNRTAQQLAQIAKMLQNAHSLNAEQLASLQKLLAQIASMCLGECQAQWWQISPLDQEALLALLAAFQKNGKFGFGIPGLGLIPGGMSNGAALFGSHRRFSAMKDPGKTKAHLLIANSKSDKMGQGKSGSLQEFIHYLAMHPHTPSHAPNGMILGTRTQKGNELSIQFLGDPEGGVASQPYYQALITNQRQAESVLNQEHVPVTLRQQVRAYFDTLHGEGK